MRRTALLLLLATGACSPSPGEDRAPYAFFVAGHVYGTPGAPSTGVYPPMKEAFGLLRAEPGLALGVLTGDIVDTPTNAAYDAVDAETRSERARREQPGSFAGMHM